MLVYSSTSAAELAHTNERLCALTSSTCSGGHGSNPTMQPTYCRSTNMSALNTFAQGLFVKPGIASWFWTSHSSAILVAKGRNGNCNSENLIGAGSWWSKWKLQLGEPYWRRILLATFGISTVDPSGIVTRVIWILGCDVEGW
jgi:hypothetical protein